MDTTVCTSCCRSRPLQEFPRKRNGNPYRTCNSCRARNQRSRALARNTDSDSNQQAAVEPPQGPTVFPLRPATSPPANQQPVVEPPQGPTVQLSLRPATPPPANPPADPATPRRHRRSAAPVPAAFISEFHRVERQDLGRMDIACTSCGALHWIHERVAGSSLRSPLFEKCCKKGKVQLPMHREPPRYLRDLIRGDDPRSGEFRNHLRQYNAAFAFTSIMYGDKTGQPEDGVRCFQIHGELYHLQGPLEPRSADPRYAQTYLYDPAEATDARARRNPILDREVIGALTEMLHEIRNPFISIYRTARERLLENAPSGERINVILNPQLRLVLERGADRRRENLPTADEVAIILPDEREEGSSRDIVLARRDARGAPVPAYERIDCTHPAYWPLHYVLLFPHGDLGRNFSQRLHDNDGTVTDKRLEQRAYFRYYLHPRIGQYSILFAARRLFQQYIVDIWATCEHTKLAWIRSNQDRLRADVYNGVADAFARGDLDAQHLGRRIILPSSHTGSERNMQQRYYDAMALVREFGKPTLFITTSDLRRICSSAVSRLSSAVTLPRPSPSCPRETAPTLSGLQYSLPRSGPACGFFILRRICV